MDYSRSFDLDYEVDGGTEEDAECCAGDIGESKDGEVDKLGLLFFFRKFGPVSNCIITLNLTIRKCKHDKLKNNKESKATTSVQKLFISGHFDLYSLLIFIFYYFTFIRTRSSAK